ncbi:MAG: hypothetical protein BGP25_05360 [Lysobacterales bacterium 63-13]|nr:MAG: hypothetical protein BGP25_05360 [Xanthomonadales bacterium 63-13]
MIVGLDLGYSAIKLASSDPKGAPPHLARFPAGACPIAHLPKAMGGDVDLGSAVRVDIDGETYAALAEPRDFQNFQPPLHEFYSQSREYRALFLASLFKVGARHIDFLVTGLPVSQAKDRDFRLKLQDTLTGEHRIRDSLTVTVGRVKVLPQPVGAWMNWLIDNPPYRTRDVRALIFDVGFYSVDWVILERGKVLDAASGSSYLATSKVLEEAARLIQLEHKTRYSLARLEEAMRSGQPNYFVGDRELPLQPMLNRAARNIAENVLNEVRQSLRTQTDSLDLILLAGGGSGLYANAVREAFPQVRVVVAGDAVMANARGFYYFGEASRT